MRLMFLNDDHKRYFENNKEMDDPQINSFVYLIGMLEETRTHRNDISYCSYDCLFKDWQSDESLQICVLAFNLFDNFKGANIKNNKALGMFLSLITPYELFSYDKIKRNKQLILEELEVSYILSYEKNYRACIHEAIKIRFEEDYYNIED